MTNEDDGDLNERPAMKSPRRLARIAGVLYLLVGIFGGFAEGFVLWIPRSTSMAMRRPRPEMSSRTPDSFAWVLSPTSWMGHSSSSWP